MAEEQIKKPISRTASARQFVLGALWMLLSFHTYGLFARSLSPDYAFLASQSCTLLALLCGFYFFSSVFDGQPRPLRSMGFVVRSSAKREWALGLAIGWGMLVLLVLPMVLVGRLTPSFSFSAVDWSSFVLATAILLVSALAEEVGFRGYPFQRLIEAAGPAWATVFMAAIFGLVHLQAVNATVVSTLSAMLAGILYSIAYLRTRALWLSWGLHFGWTFSMGVLFGLPVEGIQRYASIVQMTPHSPWWLTGGFYGPQASVLAPIVLLAGIAVMVRATREYAWEYTFEAPSGAGYPMDAPPPPQHQAMEQAAKPAPLVQIQPVVTTPVPKKESPLE